jgi:hypothetical protein
MTHIIKSLKVAKAKLTPIIIRGRAFRSKKTLPKTYTFLNLTTQNYA